MVKFLRRNNYKILISSLMISSISLLVCYFKKNDSLINRSLCKNYRKIKWHESHLQDKKGRNSAYLGGGMLYYGLIQTSLSKVAVVIGSGAGFVPKIVAQAQRDADIKDAVTYYIDADINVINPLTGQEYGKPELEKVILDQNLFLLKMRSSYASKLFLKDRIKIDYLHIDGDHSLQGILEDWHYYQPLLSENAIVTFHDYSSVADVPAALKKIQKSNPSMQFTVFPNAGAGIVVAQIGALDIKERKDDPSRKAYLSCLHKAKNHTLAMEDVFLLPQMQGKSHLESRWSYLTHLPFQKRYKLASQFLSDCNHMIEIGGFPNSMIYFAPKEIKNLSIVEPLGTNEWIKKVSYESMKKKINLLIYPTLNDLNIPGLAPYNLVLLGLELSYLDEQEIRNLLLLCSKANRMVVETSTYSHSVALWDFLSSILRPKIVEKKVLSLDTNATIYKERTMYFIEGTNPIENFTDLERIRSFIEAIKKS